MKTTYSVLYISLITAVKLTLCGGGCLVHCGSAKTAKGVHGLLNLIARDVSSADDPLCLDIHLYADACEDDALTVYEVIALKTLED